MSVERVHRATLRCDRHGCTASLFWQTAHYLPNGAVDEHARRNGWTKKDGQHFCREHSEVKP